VLEKFTIADTGNGVFIETIIYLFFACFGEA
jgi:hypothetical protein